jgi:hypothetical protein
MSTGRAVRLEPRPFRARRDGLVAAAFVLVVAGCVAAASVWGHAAFVLGAVYGMMAGLVWMEAFRSSWAIGEDELASRRWARWRLFRTADVQAVSIDAGEPGIDLSIGGPRHRRVVVPLDEWRRRPGAVDGLREFLTRAEAAGARIDDAVWNVLGATAPA